ncbi:MAG: AraC family transcriptional regulator [Bacteroidota bacterium]|jgi:AraC-like DNA-binding protein|nr:AraC family transcriptional regulator [Bacteroidota bacterium]HHU95775.1 helix-turn-helix transcriptional regulator [Petrimonas sp.]
MLITSFFALMPTFVCLFWGILLLGDKQRNLPKSYLAFFMFVTLINYFTHATFFLREVKLFAFMDNVWVFTSLASYPLYYYYIRLLTKDTKINWKWLVILLPAFLVSLFSFTLYFLMSQGELELFIYQSMYHQPAPAVDMPLLVRLQVLRTIIFKWIFGIQVVLVLFYGTRLISSYNKKLTDFYSDKTGRDLSIFKMLLLALVFSSLISGISAFIGKEFFIDRKSPLAVISLLHSTFLFWIGYVGFYQNLTISDFKKDVAKYKQQLQQSGHIQRKEKKETGMMDELNALVSKNQLFTNPDLQVSDLAIRLKTNRSYISRTINQDMQTNFCDWINSYRVDYAKELMHRQEPELTIESIAEKSGFSNITTFYRVFKKHEKCTPGKYMTRGSK